jgi:uroporphyrin-III C-methyltransferase/precorrin-2 dehydrogenase/sirohydrochlorin ferrochelatase/uroporphyrin-III C-methyltransferase
MRARKFQTNVLLVGAGPGDPDLLTIKALRALQHADIILHDSLVGEQILGLASDGAELIDVGKRCGKHSSPQNRINQLLVTSARTGKLVVRLKGGDPMIFGRATEEMNALKAANIKFEIIPGITTATAAAATIQTSLTKRGAARSLHFLTGHGAEDGLPAHDWVALTKSGGTLVIYMGSQTLAGLASHLIEAGMNPTMPAIAIENASLPIQRNTHATISTLPRQLGRPVGPTIILIGEALTRETVEAAAAQAVGF